MNSTVLMGSPRKQGNTAALLAPFLQECAAMGGTTRVISLYEKKIGPCLGCMACQDCLEGLGCIQQDDFQAVFQAMEDCDTLVLATPIYAWYCTAPMKALADRAIYAGNKKYGAGRGPALLAGKRVATLVTCGYPEEKGADLWEAGLRRWCRHGGMEYMGMLCARDLGRDVPFLTEEKERSARRFARMLCQPDGGREVEG